jgi:enoyl-CoA hydratase/carnithine racemase
MEGEGSGSGNDRILVERGEDGVATVIFSNPAKRNAFNRAMWLGLASAMRELSEDDSIRCIVLRGAGEKAFAAGADISSFAKERSTPELVRIYDDAVHQALSAVDDCRHPVVAMIMGACVGGGCGIATVCDLRIAGESARLGIPATNLGVFYSYDEIRPLVAIVGRAVANEILIEGRLLGAREAQQKGLVNRVVADGEVEAEAYAAARRIAEGAPLAARFHKRAIRRIADPEPLSAEEIAETRAYVESEDYRIGTAAFLDKEKPRFIGG